MDHKISEQNDDQGVLGKSNKSGRVIGGTLCKACLPHVTLVLLYALGKVWAHSIYLLNWIKIEILIWNSNFFPKTIILIGAPNSYKLTSHINISTVLSRLKILTASLILTYSPRWTHLCCQGMTQWQGAFPGSSTTWLCTLSIRRDAGRRSEAS